MFTPVMAPRIPQGIVFVRVLLSKAYCNNSMVDNRILTTSRENTIIVKAPRGSIDRDNDRANLIERLQKRSTLVLWELVEGLHCNVTHFMLLLITHPVVASE